MRHLNQVAEVFHAIQWAMNANIKMMVELLAKGRDLVRRVAAIEPDDAIAGKAATEPTQARPPAAGPMCLFGQICGINIFFAVTWLSFLLLGVVAYATDKRRKQQHDDLPSAAAPLKGKKPQAKQQSSLNETDSKARSFIASLHTTYNNLRQRPTRTAL